jgi:GT2 family glycosyltransferase
MSAAEFSEKSALGLSLKRMGDDSSLVARVTVANRRGLAELYNEVLRQVGDENIVVFMHDDVWIEDFYLGLRLVEALKIYDIVGIAGNRRRLPGQPSWAFVDTQWHWDQREYLSGMIAAGKSPFGKLDYFGPVPAACELLDGVFLAAKKSVLVEHGVAFDPRFSFHFYDMDFCRSARSKGLKLGTWPICLTHESSGSFGTPHWVSAYRKYLEKWGA